MNRFQSILARWNIGRDLPELLERLGTCSRCGNDLDSDERTYPYHAPRDLDRMCWNCYRDDCLFDCCLCCESAEISERGALGNIVVAFDEDAGVPVGSYEVTCHSYYTQAVVGCGWLHEGFLRLIGPVPPEADGDGYPAGHLCSACSEKVKKENAKKMVTA